MEAAWCHSRSSNDDIRVRSTCPPCPNISPPPIGWRRPLVLVPIGWLVLLTAAVNTCMYRHRWLGWGRYVCRMSRVCGGVCVLWPTFTADSLSPQTKILHAASKTAHHSRLLSSIKYFNLEAMSINGISKCHRTSGSKSRQISELNRNQKFLENINKYEQWRCRIFHNAKHSATESETCQKLMNLLQSPIRMLNKRNHEQQSC